ncbi:SDR family NAD(P)-dependent oxidoreductase [Devosia sp. 1566]|uniref:SDR family NAD(P)-dependent oxidoreductase n=1 Tax=Devosia sp. 1566 TaxID=2499144 RepID=UPI000FD8519A|nr:SDR family NAD(P)-dependent oxidoreductase [Devosia sp. 1566]
MSEFVDKTALVTGAGSGIGEATARALHGAGARVFVGVHTLEQAQRLQRELPGIVAAPCDVRDPAAVERMVAQAVAAFGRLELCVNCVGITGPAPTPIADYDPTVWAEVIATDLTGMFHCLKYQVPALAAAGTGAIVNLSSANGVVGIPGMAAYTAAKHGVVGLTRSAALELANIGIRVNAVAPGYVATPKVLAAGEDALTLFRQSHPMGRLAEPEEVAEFILFLLSPRSAFATGAVYALDGGYTAQ